MILLIIVIIYGNTNKHTTKTCQWTKCFIPQQSELSNTEVKSITCIVFLASKFFDTFFVHIWRRSRRFSAPPENMNENSIEKLRCMKKFSCIISMEFYRTFPTKLVCFQKIFVFFVFFSERVCVFCCFLQLQCQMYLMLVV